MSEHKLTTTLINDITVTVHFDYQPEEVQTQTYPGCPAIVELNSVYIDQQNIMEVLSQSVLGDVADKCMALMHTERLSYHR